ncbi:MAG: ribose-phosphate pyrophosphokinase [Provencibacterium sp.]|nr:ribose-phosphate pyrophosphokinase [Provencibacterium sp.]
MKQGHDLAIIAMKGCEQIASDINYYLCDWRDDEEHNYMVPVTCPRFGSGEAKAVIQKTARGRDIFILCDVFNYGITYRMYGQENRMSPDDHFQDLKRVIAALGGKARRITVIMPMLYEGRQHKRTGRESLDCAIALQELENMRVSNVITFDAHDPRVQNAIPLSDFDDLRPTYQMLKALTRCYQDIRFDKSKLMIVSPDEGGMQRCMYYSSVLGLDLGMFYKKRDYSVVVDGKNPIESHRWLGSDVQGKDVIIVDDMISSGESMIDVAGKLKAMGAGRIFVFSTFGLFCNGLEVFDRAYAQGVFTKIFTTNLIYRTPELLQRSWYCEVNMAKYLAYIIDAINEECSVSAMFNPYKKIEMLIQNMQKEG